MRKYLLLAAAATVVATPAVARDRSTYVGIEAGGMIVEDTGLDYEDAVDSFDDAFVLNHKTGLDVGLIGGYDFGAVRGEVELAYKRASIDQVEMEGFPGGGQGVYLESDGRTRVISGMVNALIDIGDDNGWSGYFGPGVGLAFLKHRASVVDPELGGTGVFGLAAEDRGFAWQLIAGVRRAITPNMDVGVKYRMFTTRFEHSEADGAGVGNPPFTLDGRFRSHSLLASLIYNFAPPPPPPPVYAPPPPPPPPPPATQTCPDGSVVLATDPCPLPPPPPPPPPPLPERG